MRAQAESEDGTDIVSAKKDRDNDFYKKTQKEITNKAFRHSKK